MQPERKNAFSIGDISLNDSGFLIWNHGGQMETILSNAERKNWYL